MTNKRTMEILTHGKAVVSITVESRYICLLESICKDITKQITKPYDGDGWSHTNGRMVKI